MSATEQALWSTWAAERDDAIFETLVSPHLGFAVDLARRLGCSPADADDLVQQSLYELLQATDDRPAKVGLRAWLGRRISLGARTLRRARRRRNRHEARAPARPAAVAPLEARDEVEAALDLLAPEEREAVVLRYLHDLEYVEIAYVLGTSRTASRVRVHRGLTKLRARLGRNATALIATCALLAGATPATALRPLAGGFLVMGKNLKIGVLLLLLVLVAWFAVPPSEHRTTRATAPGAKETTADAAFAERVDATGSGDTPTAREPAPDTTEPPNWHEYDTLRHLSGLARRSRDLNSRLEAPGIEHRPEPALRPDATSRLYLEELVETYRTLPEGAERHRLFQTFVTAHRRYVQKTGDAYFLPFLGEVADRGSAAERTRAVALDGLSLPPVVDFLLRALEHRDPAVRAAAVGALADVRGAEAGRAHARVVGALQDAAASVRWTAAMKIEFVFGRREHVGALLLRIPVETHPVAMHALVSAVLALDPEDGRGRIEGALGAAPADIAALGRNALDRKPASRPLVGAAGAPAEAAVTRDSTTRAYVERLSGEFATLPRGTRLETLKTLVRAHRDYLRRTGDTSLLDTLAAVVDESDSPDERRTVITSLYGSSQPAVVDRLVGWAAHEDPAIRRSAVATLASIGGEQRPRARDALIARLEDDDRRVRANAAMSLGREPVALDPLLSRLGRETDYVVVYSIVRSLRKLDAAGWRTRVDSAELPAGTRALVERATTKLPPDGGGR